MQLLSNFIDNLIPDRFQLTYELKTKVKGALYVQLIIGILLVFLGLFLGLIDTVWHELILNFGTGVFLLISMATLKFFNKFESYINFVLSIGYISLAFFLIKTGGIYTDTPFWFALLISINVFYTTAKQYFFWMAAVALFLSIMFYLQITGLDLHYSPASYTKKATTIFSFSLLLITVAYSYSRINKRKNFHHLEIIANHKRLLKERDDLMSIIAHDMKSPARRIKGLISIFETENLSKSQTEILFMLNKTAHESKQLIDDLLEATSFQASLTIKNTHINEIITDLKTGFLPLASKKDIRIISRGLRLEIWVETSSSQLRRILDNLLSNAIKFSPIESRIEIICVQNKTRTSISIQDLGPGFTKKDEEGMFKMFKKLTARPTGGESSTGLGLSIVKNLTELLQGEIKYVTQVGVGSTFTLVLPNKFPPNGDKS